MSALGDEERTRLAQLRTELSQQRTEWSDYRTKLSVDRTKAGYVRTSIGAIAAALASFRLFQGFAPTVINIFLAAVLLLIGALSAVLGALTGYHDGSLHRTRFVIHCCFWLLLGVTIVMAILVISLSTPFDGVVL
ncbi:hypothetical protein P9112_012722 [Eukaryota sp. TZLM1-RC]